VPERVPVDGTCVPLVPPAPVLPVALPVPVVPLPVLPGPVVPVVLRDGVAPVRDGVSAVR